MKKALVFGGSGQAGYYMIKYLGLKGYSIFAPTHEQCDVTNCYSVVQTINNFKPDEVYNFAGVLPDNQDWLFDDPETNILSVRYIMDSLFELNPKAKFFHASSASVFKPSLNPLHEASDKVPVTTYGVSKLAAQELVRLYREHGFFACTGIFFNMESERRSPEHFTRKVTLGIAQIVKHLQEGSIPPTLILGNLSANRDWGLTSDYVEAAFSILAHYSPDEYVIGTGAPVSCYAFLRYCWELAGLDDYGFSLYVNYKTDNIGKIDTMWANSAKIIKQLKWTPKGIWTDVAKYLLDFAMKEVGVKEYGKSLTTR